MCFNQNFLIQQLTFNCTRAGQSDNKTRGTTSQCRQILLGKDRMLSISQRWRRGNQKSLNPSCHLEYTQLCVCASVHVTHFMHCITRKHYCTFTQVRKSLFGLFLINWYNRVGLALNISEVTGQQLQTDVQWLWQLTLWLEQQKLVIYQPYVLYRDRDRMHIILTSVNDSLYTVCNMYCSCSCA